MSYKYPYIADKRLYAAVMGACSYIRETGYFNKAISYYADKYGVDEEQIASEIRKRQAAGRKNKESGTKGRKFRFFIVAQFVSDDVSEEWDICRKPEIVKGIDAESVKTRFSEFDHNQSRREDYGGNYANFYAHFILANEDGYATKKEAEKALFDLLNSKKETS